MAEIILHDSFREFSYEIFSNLRFIDTHIYTLDVVLVEHIDNFKIFSENSVVQLSFLLCLHKSKSQKK